jgi:hypothetical protein
VAVHELASDARLAWSPRWTLVPEVEVGPRDVDYARRQRERAAQEKVQEAQWKAEAEAAWARVARQQAEQEAQRARPMDFSRYRGQGSPTDMELRAADALVGWGGATTEADVRAACAAGPSIMEPAPGAREFRHAMPMTGLPCVTARGAAVCGCGFYRMTWTTAEVAQDAP